jgi:hypothetical protein
VASGLDGAGELAFVLERSRLQASLSGTRFQLEAIAPEWNAVAAVLPAPWRFELARPVGISVSFRDEDILLEGGGDLALATAGPHLSAALSATLAMDSDRRVREVVVPDAEINLRDVRWADLRLDRASIRTQSAGSLEEWAGTLDLDVAGAGAPWPGLTLEAGTAQAALDVRFAAGRLNLRVREQGALQVGALSWGDVRLDGLEVHVQPSATPLLSAEVVAGAIEWQQHLKASLPAFEVVVAAGDAPLRLAAEAEALQLDLAGTADGLDRGRVVLSGGAVKSPAHQLRLSGIDAEGHLSAAGLDPDRPIPISIAAIVHEGAPPWSAPLRLQGSVQPEGDRITFDAKLAHTAGAVEMRVRGQHDLASAEGRAQIDLPPVDLAPGKLQPGQLSPWLGDMMEEVSGRLALDGALSWGAGDELRADLDLLVNGLAFASGAARLEQVNGVIALDELMPPSTPPGQQLAIGLVDIGLPLTDGLLTFDLEPGQLVVEQLRWQFAEGRIRAAPFTIGSEGIQFSTRAPATGRDLRARTARRTDRRRNDAWHPTDHRCRQRGDRRGRCFGVRPSRLGALPTGSGAGGVAGGRGERQPAAAGPRELPL